MALLAYRRGEDNEHALLGALMEAEYQSAVITLVEGWIKVHSKTNRSEA